MEERILIVDDHSMVREALRFIFAAAGIPQVTEATNCEEALDAVRKESFNLVLLDMALGNENGLDALQEIRAIDSSIPIVVHSHHDRSTLLWRSYHYGAAGYLVKGLDKNDLLQTVRRAAAGARVWTAEQLQTINEMDEEYGEGTLRATASQTA